MPLDRTVRTSSSRQDLRERGLRAGRKTATETLSFSKMLSFPSAPWKKVSIFEGISVFFQGAHFRKRCASSKEVRIFEAGPRPSIRCGTRVKSCGLSAFNVLPLLRLREGGEIQSSRRFRRFEFKNLW